WLATRSQNEMAHANLEQERREIEQNPEEEIEEMSLFYQLKGLGQADADQLARKLAENPEAMLETQAFEELGGLEGGGNPWSAGLAGFISTAAGAIVPVLPFFWFSGLEAVILAAVISLLAHFLVGAAKSLVTLRSWWGAGLEMTLAVVLVGAPTYALGFLFKLSL
ncbi:MAG: VIT1/CCC1 transporter family protein, partial [Candidatus Dormibacteraceae bacterium]